MYIVARLKVIFHNSVNTKTEEYKTSLTDLLSEMKSILIWLFVFTLGSLAANIPTDENNNDVPMSPEDVSAESSEKQSSDPALSSSVLITKRGVGRHNSPGLLVF